MKKFFYSVLAAATMMLAVTSCSEDDPMTPEIGHDGKTQKVTFKVEMPGETASRAIADGVEVAQANMANKLAWALYESSKVDQAPVLTGNATKNADSKEFNVSIDMVKGLEYKVLFLAYCDGGTIFDVAPGDDLKSLKYNPSVVSNQEAYDAFVACHTHTVNNDVVTEVTLTRPFAQINAATTDADLTRAASLQATVTHSSLTIANVPTQYNVLTGEASAYQDVTYGFGAILKDYATQTNEILTVDNTDYNYLNMVYVLADASSSTHSATFTFYRNSDEADAIRTIDIVNLPIQRNYRTNVIGDLITQTEAFKIVIDEEFDGNHNLNGSEQAATTTNVATMDELQDAINAANGPTIIKFEQDINANSSRAVSGVTILQKEATDLVIDGCGFKFDGQIKVSGQGRSTGDETLTFRNIKFSTASEEEFTFVDATETINNLNNYSHNVTIEDCTFEYTGTGVEIGSASFKSPYNFVMKNCAATNMHSLLQVQSCDNSVTVDNVTVTNCKNGISFGNTAYPTIKNSTINATAYGIRGDGNANRGNLVIENTAINAEKPVIIRKVTTDGYAVAFEGENTLTTNQGYQVVFTNGSDDAEYAEPTGTFTITGAEGFIVYPTDILVKTVADLKAAIMKSGSIKIANDIVISDKWSFRTDGEFQNEVIIDGNGHTITFAGEVSNPNNNNAFRFLKDATIQNLTIDMSQALGSNLRAISTQAGITVDNCKIIGNENGKRGIIFAEGATEFGNVKISIKNSEFSNWKRGITDNENGKDVKSVFIEENTFTNAPVYVSAFESITFVKNNMNASLVNLTSYTSASTAKVKATDNTLDASAYNVIGSASKKFDAANVEAQEGFVVNLN